MEKTCSLHGATPNFCKCQIRWKIKLRYKGVNVTIICFSFKLEFPSYIKVKRDKMMGYNSSKLGTVLSTKLTAESEEILSNQRKS